MTFRCFIAESLETSFHLRLKRKYTKSEVQLLNLTNTYGARCCAFVPQVLKQNRDSLITVWDNCCLAIRLKVYVFVRVFSHYYRRKTASDLRY